jgi:uncharacterized membrane protein
MDNTIIKYFTIYLVGITGIWKAIPVGIALKSSLYETACFTALGSITTVIILYYFGEPVKQWAIKKWGKDKMDKRKGKFSAIMDKYGVVGLGLLTPGPFGPITTIIVGLLIVKNTSRLMPYLIAGIIIWSFILTWVASTSVDLLENFF